MQRRSSVCYLWSREQVYLHERVVEIKDESQLAVLQEICLYVHSLVLFPFTHHTVSTIVILLEVLDTPVVRDNLLVGTQGFRIDQLLHK